MPRMGFEHMIRMFQLLKAEHVLLTTVIGIGYCDSRWWKNTAFTFSM